MFDKHILFHTLLFIDNENTNETFLQIFAFDENVNVAIYEFYIPGECLSLARREMCLLR